MRRKTLTLVLFFCLLLLNAAAAVAAERFALQAGTPWESYGCILDSGRPGPAALILGGVHGNEPAGALAAEQVCRFLPIRGVLVVLPRVNPPGLAANVRYLPDMGDMNRVYPPRGQNTPAEKVGAEIISLMERWQIAMLIDLHEARTFHRLDRTSLGQTLLFTENSRSAALAMDAVEAVNRGLPEALTKFSLVGHPIPYSAAWYAGTRFGIPAFTVETSSRQPLEDRVEQHLAMVRELLTAGGWLRP